MVYEVLRQDSEIFDQNDFFPSEADQIDQAWGIADTVLKISGIVIDFASIERVPRYCRFKRENDAEHSLMLALAGVELSTRYYPGLDSGLVAKLALVHDFPELMTGDVATFDISDEDLAEKHKKEAEKLPELLKELPPHIGDLLVLYEEQQIPEAKFVKHTDKLLPNAVNYNGAGRQVMYEDYKVFTQQQFRNKNEELEKRFGKIFDDPSHKVLHLAHTALADVFVLHLPVDKNIK